MTDLGLPSYGCAVSFAFWTWA